MYWHDKQTSRDTYTIPLDVVDLAFRIRCRTIRLDHAHALAQAIHIALPWFSSEAEAGLHLIHGAESGNGWMRPEEDADALLYPSRRTRMTLRLPSSRLEQARALSGRELDIGGHGIRLGDSDVRPFSILPTQFSRHVAIDDVASVDTSNAGEAQDESLFLERVDQELRQLGIEVRKLLCGKSHILRFPHGVLLTRSVMIADLEPAEALLLQRYGIGAARKMGCGLFIPHRDIKAVYTEQD